MNYLAEDDTMIDHARPRDEDYALSAKEDYAMAPTAIIYRMRVGAAAIEPRYSAAALPTIHFVMTKSLWALKILPLA